MKSNIRNIVPLSSSEANENGTEPQLDVIVLGGLGGRVDQAFSQIHHLYTASNSSPSAADRPPGDLYLISEESITFLLPTGLNSILTPGGSLLQAQARRRTASRRTAYAHSKDEGTTADGSGPQLYLSENVGIIPVGGCSVISTKGLEWDIHDWKTEFGGQVSTSNHIRADAVEVRTTVPVLFTMELADWLKFNGRRA